MLFTNSRNKQWAALALACNLFLALLLIPAPATDAADHGDAPANANDRQADLADTFIFLDPNDNSRMIIAMTSQGFIVPGEAVNFGFFDHNLRYRFELETTDDARPDHFIDVSFSEKMTAPNNPQTATVAATFFATLSGPTTVANLSPTAAYPTITTDAAMFIYIFAGIV